MINIKNLQKFDLTKREMEVIDYLVKGFSNLQIAQMLGINVSMVKVSLQSIMKKLGVNNRVEMIVIVIKNSD